ncbi:hypothetical protein HCU64_23125 [Methylobacterium sp. C25]|uniref:hypothetical protein n=1 Tax=Methylobacterium sp. C25 TaxID=2721622 RepID=UPI001F20A7D6|nr:hypothetical protein [Methylobacterium sp. C25]MCE4226638.1 hypothetical protein [Methylobacterium sp. C25]
MGNSFDGSWTNPGAGPAAAQSDLVTTLKAVGAVCTPINLSLSAAVVVGWLSILAWTGAGPHSWQARSCAEFGSDRPACGMMSAKDQNRLPSHGPGGKGA